MRHALYIHSVIQSLSRYRAGLKLAVRNVGWSVDLCARSTVALDVRAGLKHLSVNWAEANTQPCLRNGASSPNRMEGRNILTETKALW